MRSTVAIRGGLIHSVAGDPLKNGWVLIEEGKIKAVGKDLPLPPDVHVVDARDSVITPGLIDAHTHLGVLELGVGWEGADGDETSDTLLFPHLRVIDAINPHDESFSDALSAGVTTALVAATSLSLISGQALVLKTPPRPIVDEMVIQNPAGLKMSLGENPKRENQLSRNRYPRSRMGLAASLREALTAAQDHRDAMIFSKTDGSKAPTRDLRMEPLVCLLDREFPIHMHVHRADDIVTAVRIAEEFNVKLVLHHATEAYKITDFLVRHQIPAVYGPFIISKRKVEMRDLDPDGVRKVMGTGLKVAITTDHPIVPIKYAVLNAIPVIRAGLSPELALKALTLYAAEILGLGNRLGSLEPGKDADLVIFSDDPFATQARVRAVYADGERVWEESDGAS